MNNTLLRTRARSLRKSSTNAERLIWFRLRNNRLGVKFRRQVPIDNYIVDFVCFEKRLVIEIDGSQHFDNEAYDSVRTQRLNALGFNVIRFWNNEVLEDLSLVMDVIFSKVVG